MKGGVISLEKQEEGREELYLYKLACTYFSSLVEWFN